MTIVGGNLSYPSSVLDSFFHQELRPQGIHERVSSWWKFPADLRPTHSPEDDASNFVEVFCIEKDFTILNSLPTIHAGRPKFNPVGEVGHSISSKSALGGQAFLELGNGMSTDSALASEASIIRAELLFHQNRPPRRDRVSSFAEAARTSRYTASPSPGSEPSLWMHSRR